MRMETTADTMFRFIFRLIGHSYHLKLLQIPKITFVRYRGTIFAQVSQYIRQSWAVNISDIIIVNGPSAEMEGFSTPSWNLKGLCIEMCLSETQITFCRFSRNMLSYDFQRCLNCGTRAHNFYCKSYQAISAKASSKFWPTFLDNQP